MNILKGAAIFVAGAAAGATGSYIYFKKLYDEKKEELNELKEHYAEKLNKEADLKVTENIIEKEGYVSYDRKINEEGVEDLSRRIELVQKKAVENDRPSEDYPEEPIVITEDEYSGTELYFDKIEVDYYLGDGALVDENEELIEVEDVLGYDILEDFINNESEDTIYVRNANRSADYMVRKVSGSFSEIVGVGGDIDD